MKTLKFNLENRKGQKIIGILTKPNDNIIGTAVLQHGYGGFKEQSHLKVLEKVLLKHNFQVFNFDTTNSFGESEGKYKDARLGLHAEDFEDTVKWVLNQNFFSGKLLVSGHSMGGFSSTRYSFRYNENTDFLISFAPVVSGKYWVEAYNKYYPDLLKKWKKEGIVFEKSKSKPGLVKEKPYEVINEALNHNLLNEDKKIENALFIACSDDTSCLPESIKKLYEETTSENKSFEILENCPHTPMKQKHLEDLEKIVDSWLIKSL